MENSGACVVVIVLLISMIIPWWYFSTSTDPGPSSIKKTDFNEYYGISPNRNHFTTNKIDECHSKLVFKLMFPSAIIDKYNSPISFILLSEYGTGKSLLRCLYLNNIQSNDYLKVLISTEQLNEYLKRFIGEMSNVGITHKTHNNLIGWTKYEFAQMILSISVTQFINQFNEEKFKSPRISLDEKIELLTIICYYYNDLNMNKLETFVNAFLEKSSTSPYKQNKIRVQVNEDGQYRDKSLLRHFKGDLKKLTMISQNQNKLELLLGIVEGEDYHDSAIDKSIAETIFQSLTQFTQFLKNHMKKPVLLVIDGLDENEYFFPENEADKLSLELFLRSSFSSEILSSIMSKNFYLALFYPKVLNVKIEEPIYRGEKLNIYTIEWNTKLLINYADYIIEQMNERASSSRTQAIPDFRKFVNYDNSEIAAIISRIPTPRALHLFFIELIKQFTGTSFQVTTDNIKIAFQKSFQNFYNRYV